MIRHFSFAYSLTSDKIKLPLFLYGIQLFLGILAAALFYKTAYAAAAGSLAVNQLLVDFNYMVFSDFMRLHGNKFLPLLLFISVLSFLFFIFNAFLTGGLFGSLRSAEKFSFRAFIRAGFSTFGKYLFLLVIQLIVSLVSLLLMGIVYALFVSLAEGGNEREYFFWLLLPTVLTIVLLSIIIVIFDYARIIIFENRRFNAFEGFGKGIGYVFRNFKTVGWYWVMVLLNVAAGLIYLATDAVLGMSSVFTVVVMFVFQQLLVFVRSFLRVMNFAVVTGYYSQNPPPQPTVLPTSPALPFDEMSDDFPENKPSQEE